MHRTNTAFCAARQTAVESGHHAAVLQQNVVPGGSGSFTRWLVTCLTASRTRVAWISWQNFRLVAANAVQEQAMFQSAGARRGVGSLHIDHEAARTSLPAPGSYTPEGLPLSSTKQTFNNTHTPPRWTPPISWVRRFINLCVKVLRTAEFPLPACKPEDVCPSSRRLSGGYFGSLCFWGVHTLNSLLLQF